MEKYDCFVLIFLTVFAFLQPAQAIKCYSCAGAPCGDPFRGTVAGQVDCVMACEKRTVTGFTSKGAEDVSYVKIGDVLRRCANSTRKPGCKDQEDKGVKGRECFCMTNLCNGSYYVRTTMATETIILLFILQCLL